MLFKQVHLQGIRSGDISLAFRKWDKASVNQGTLLKTAIGLVEIFSIATIEEDLITEVDVLRAGFENKEQLLKSLRDDDKGNIYRIEVRYHSEDPRIELRDQKLTDERYETLKEKLIRLDKYSKQGNWTQKILLTIKDNPHLHAIGITNLTGFQKEWLKINI
ncbi:hypothetical protein [Pararhodonellum marinum]|uniref:hypothetical protein n=1 Tax=Pararhodonellum marinum TaxID=2755358 RepID=UPI0018904DD5|nr:hypothetical protein [Pararhodonellum marinum]